LIQTPLPSDDRYGFSRPPGVYHGAGVGATFAAAFRDMNLLYNLGRWEASSHEYTVDPAWTMEMNKLRVAASGLGDYVAKYPRLMSARSRQEHQAVTSRAKQEIQDRSILHNLGFFESLMYYLPVGMTSPENWVPLSRAFRLGMTGSRAGAFKVAAGTGGRAVTEAEKAALIAAHRTHPAIVSAAHIGDDMTHGLAQNLLQRVALSKTTVKQAAAATGLEGAIAGAVSEMVLQKAQPLRTMEETWMSIVGGGVFGAVLGGGFYAIGKTYRGALTSLLGQEVAGNAAAAARREAGNALNEVVDAGASGWIRKSDGKAMDEDFPGPEAGKEAEYDFVEVAPGADTRAAANEAVARVVDEENAARAADDDDAPTELAQAEEVAPSESATEVATSDAAIASPAEVLISKRMHEALLRLDADTNTVSSKVARLVGLAEGNSFWGRLVGRWLLWSPNTRMGQEVTDYGRQMYQLFSGGALTQEAGSRGHGVNRPGMDAASQYMEVMNLRLVGELAKLAREVTASSGVSEIDLRSLAHSYAVRSYEDDGVTPRALDLADEFHESSGLEGAERSVYDIINKIEDPTARQAAVDGVERAVKEIYDPFIENTGKLLRSMGLLKLDSSQTRRMAAMYVARMYDATKIRKHYDAFFASVRAGIEEWKASDEPALVASIEVQRQLVADPGSTAADAAHLVVLEQRLADLIGIDDARIHAVIRNIINDPINSDMASSRMGPQNSLHERVLLLRDEFVEPFLVKDIGLVMQTITKRHIPKVAIYRYLASPVQLELMQRTLDQYEAFDDMMKALRDPATGKIPDNLPRAEVEKVTKAMNDLFQSTNLLRLHNGLRLLSVFKPEVAGQAVEANGQAVDMVGITNRIKDLLQEHRDASDTAHNQQVVADGFEEKLLSLEQDIEASMRDAIGGTTPAESVLDAATLRQHQGSLIVQMLDDMVARADSDEIRDAGAEVQAAVSTLTSFGDEGERALRGEAFLTGLKTDIRETVEREFAAVVESSRTPDNNNQGGDVSTRVANMGPAAWVLHLAKEIHDPEKLISEGWASREMIDLVESKFLKGGIAEARGESVTKGVFQLAPHGLKDVIKGFSGADFSTAVHEVGHALRLRTLTRAKITDGHAGDVTHQDMDDLELWANDGRALDPLAEGEDRVWTTAMEEKFARAFEQYVAEGKFQPGVSAGVKRVMEAMKEAMKRVYQAFAGRFSAPLDPRVKTVFDKLLLSDDDIKAAAARETNDSPHRRLTESQKADIKRVFHLSDSEADGIYELYDALNLDKGMIVFRDSSEGPSGGLEQRTEGKGEFLADNKVDLAGWVDEFTNHPDWKERYGEEVIEGRIRTSGFRVESTAGVLFRDGLVETAATHRFGKAVEVKDQAFYLDPETRIYLARDATAGLVVTPDRDLISVHKMPGSAADINGLLAQASKFAETLDGFDINGHLPTLYGRHGWRPVARAQFNPDFRPEGWDMRPIDEGGLGTPDIVLMVYDPTDALRLPHADSFNEVRDQVPYLLMDKYDDAVALQTQAKELIRESVGGRTGDELDIQAKQYFQQERFVPPGKTDAAYMADELSDGKTRFLDAGYDETRFNYLNDDGVEVTLKNDGELIYINGEQFTGDIEIDLILSTGTRGQGAASKELDRILAAADARDMSVSLVVSAQNVRRQGQSVGLTDAQLKAWYQRKGFVFPHDDPEGARAGYRPKKADSVIEKTHQTTEVELLAAMKQVADDSFNHAHSDPGEMFWKFEQGELEPGFHEGGDDGLYFFNGTDRPLRVENAVTTFDYDTGNYTASLTDPPTELRQTSEPLIAFRASQGSPKKARQYFQTESEVPRIEGEDHGSLAARAVHSPDILLRVFGTPDNIEGTGTHPRSSLPNTPVRDLFWRTGRVEDDLEGTRGEVVHPNFPGTTEEFGLPTTAGALREAGYKGVDKEKVDHWHHPTYATTPEEHRRRSFTVEDSMKLQDEIRVPHEKVLRYIDGVDEEQVQVSAMGYPPMVARKIRNEQEISYGEVSRLIDKRLDFLEFQGLHSQRTEIEGYLQWAIRQHASGKPFLVGDDINLGTRGNGGEAVQPDVSEWYITQNNGIAITDENILRADLDHEVFHEAYIKQVMSDWDYVIQQVGEGMSEIDSVATVKVLNDLKVEVRAVLENTPKVRGGLLGSLASDMSNSLSYNKTRESRVYEASRDLAAKKKSGEPLTDAESARDVWSRNTYKESRNNVNRETAGPPRAPQKPLPWYNLIGLIDKQSWKGHEQGGLVARAIMDIIAEGYHNPGSLDIRLGQFEDNVRLSKIWAKENALKGLELQIIQSEKLPSKVRLKREAALDKAWKEWDAKFHKEQWEPAFGKGSRMDPHGFGPVKSGPDHHGSTLREWEHDGGLIDLENIRDIVPGLLEEYGQYQAQLKSALRVLYPSGLIPVARWRDFLSNARSAEHDFRYPTAGTRSPDTAISLKAKRAAMLSMGDRSMLSATIQNPQSFHKTTIGAPSPYGVRGAPEGSATHDVAYTKATKGRKVLKEARRDRPFNYEQPSDAEMAKAEGTKPGVAVHEIVHIDDILFMGATREGEVHVKRNALLYNKHRTVADLYQTSEVIQKIMDEVESLIDGKKVTPNAAVAKVLARLGWTVPMGRANQTGAKQISPKQLKSMLLALQANSKRMLFHDKADEAARFWYEDSSAGILEAFQGDLIQASMFIDVLAITSANTNPKQNLGNALDTVAKIMNLPNLKSGVANLFPSHAFPRTLKAKLEKIVLGYDAEGRAVRLGDQDWSIRLSSGKRNAFKTASFARTIHRALQYDIFREEMQGHWQSELHDVVADVWMFRHFQFGKTGAQDTPAKFNERLKRFQAHMENLSAKGDSKELRKARNAERKSKKHLNYSDSTRSLDSGKDYKFMTDMVEMLTDELNEDAYRGVTDWKPWQVQAMLWTTHRFIEAGESDPMVYHNLLEEGYPWRANHPFTPGATSTHLLGLEALPDNIRVQIAALRNRAVSDFQTDSYVIATNKGGTGHATLDHALKEVGGEAHARSTEAVRRVVSEEAKVIRVDGAVTPKGNRGHATQVVELRTGNDDRLRAAGARMGLAGGHDNVLTFRVRSSGKQALQIVEFDESLSATQIKNLLKRHKMGKHSITKGEGDGYRVFIYDDTYGKGAQLRSPVLMKVKEWVSNGKIKKHEEVRGTAERVGADDGSSKEVIAASYRDTLRGVDERGSEAHKALGTSVPYSYSLVSAMGGSARSGHNAPGADAVLLELGLPGLSSVTPGVTGTTRLFLPNQVIPSAVRKEAEAWITKTNLEQGGKPISKAIIKALAGVLNDGVHTVNAGNQWAAATAALYRLDSITWSRIVPPDLTNSKLHNGYTLMLPEGAVWDRDSLADLRAHFETLGPLAKRLRFEQQSPEGLGIYITTERGGLNWFPDSKTGSGQRRTEIDANLFPRLQEATLTIKRALAEWNKGRPEAGMVEYEGFTYVGNRLENDWSVNPNGEGYLDAPWKGPGGTAVKARVQAVVRKLLPRMDAADEVAAARYGLQVNPELLKSYRTPDHSSSIEAGRGTNTFSRGASDPSVRGREPEYFQHNERRQINSDLEALGLGGLFDSETIAGNRPEIEAALVKIREGRARIEAATRAAGGEADPVQMLEGLISEALIRAEQTGDLPEIPGFPKLTQGVQDLMAARGQEGAVRAARGALDEADPGGAPARTEVAGAQGGLRAARHGVARAESEFDSATQELRAISADLGVPTDASSRGRPADGYEPHSYAYPKRRGSSGEEMEAMAGRARAATEQVRSETSGDALSLEPHLAVIRRAYEKKVAAARTAGDDAEVKRLEKRFRQTAMDLQAMKDRILNTHGINTDAVGYGMRLAKAAKDFNYIRFMGGVTLSSLPDLAMGISVAGLRPYLSAWAKMLKAEILNDDVGRADIAKLIYAAETVLGEERVRKLYFLDDNPMQIEQTKAEKGLEWSARKFGKWSGIQYWNAVNKAVAATAIQSRVIEISRKVRAGTASAFELEMLGQFGIDTEMATLVARVHGVVGETGADLFGGDFYHSRVDLWDGPIDGLRADEVAFLKEQYYMAIMQAVNRTIVTPNAGDLPLIATSSAIGKLLFQFKSFSFAATNSVLISGLQRGLEYGDISQVILLAGLSSLGGFVYAGKEYLAGRDPLRYENDISKFIVEGMDRGGGLGILSETNAIFEKTFGFGLSQFADSGPLSRYASRNKIDALMGPTFGTAKDMLTIAGSFPKMFTADDMSGYEIDAARRMFAFQNLIQTRLALDVGPSLIQGGDDFFANFKPMHRRMAGFAGVGEE